MSRPIEDYALIGDTETVALVSRQGSIDWLCFPRFDSGACFAALLGDEGHGHWRLAPADPEARVTRRYRPGTLVLETEFETTVGTVRVTDAMPPRGTHRGDNPDLVRVVEGVSGRVPMRMQLVIRLDYGSIVPWVTRFDGGVRAVGGPDGLTLTTPVDLHGQDLRTVADFEVDEGDRVPFVLTWHPSYQPVPEAIDPEHVLDATERWWRDWSDRGTYDGPWPDAVQRSLITLKALTYAPTGGIVAAPTTSLPEDLGGSRNWDYRYTWLRDATFTLDAVLLGGYRDEAVAWRDWLLRAVAGDPSKLQIMYGLGGERRLTEHTLDWLPGYEGSTPVRIGNAAHGQPQLDTYGEVMDALHLARNSGLEPEPEVWEMQRAFMEHLEGTWDEPDHSLWEIRGQPQHFTHSKVMCWVAFDRAAQTVASSDLDGPHDRWAGLAEQVHREVCEHGFDPDLGSFTQYYGTDELDAALLLIPQVGFLPPDDERVVGTVDTIRERLTIDDVHVLRYHTSSGVDGLEGDEATFLLCSFWLVDALAMTGRFEDAERHFEQLLACRNDVGLLAEEWDPRRRRQLGNFPQAFSHVGLVNSACNLGSEVGPADTRSRRRGSQAGSS